MPLSFDPSDDFSTVADGFAAVTWTRPGGSQSVEIAAALCRAVTDRMATDFDGRHHAADVVWHLPTTELTESPRPGDLLIDTAERRWTVLSAKQTALTGSWRCRCRNLSIAQGLDDHVDIERAVVTKTDAGAEQYAWQPWRTGLAARIQPVQSDVKTEAQRRVTRNRYRVYLLEDVEIDATCRVRAADGTTYRIHGSRRAERLDELPYLEVQRED